MVSQQFLHVGRWRCYANLNWDLQRQSSLRVWYTLRPASTTTAVLNDVLNNKRYIKFKWFEMDMSEDEMEEDEAEWKNSFVDSVPLSSPATASGKVWQEKLSATSLFWLSVGFWRAETRVVSAVFMFQMVIIE